MVNTRIALIFACFRSLITCAAVPLLFLESQLHHIAASETGKLKLPLTSLPTWDREKLQNTLVPLDDTIEEIDEGETKEPITWEMLRIQLNKQFAKEYPDAPLVIMYLVTKIYQFAYQEISIEEGKETFSFCTCHPLSFRTEVMLTALRDLLIRFPASGTKKLQCAIVAPGNLLQEFIFFNLLQDACNYTNIAIYLIDLEYEDPQYSAGVTRIIKKLPPELAEKSLKELLSKPHLLHQYGEIEMDTEVVQNLKKKLTKQNYKVRVDHFRHTYGFIDWAQRNKIKLHLLLMVDPFPIDGLLDFTISKDNTYPSFSNLLMLKDTPVIQEKPQTTESSPREVALVQYILLRHATPLVPAVWYQRNYKLMEQTASKELVKGIFKKIEGAKNPVPWSTIFEAIEEYDPQQQKVQYGLASDPYTAFDDVAFSTMQPNGLAYQSQAESEEYVQSPEGEWVPKEEKVPILYIFDLKKEQERLKSGLPIKGLQDVFKKYGFEPIQK